MRSIFTYTLAAWLVCAGYSMAQSTGNPVVVELYTSQGCSSCPAADAVLAKLAKRDEVIALALHVDYWDYIGWKDTLAKPEHTKRQRAYAQFAGVRTIYTPQMIIGGMDHIIGARPAMIESRIKSQLGKTPQVRLALTREGGSARLKAVALNPLAKGAIVQLVRYSPSDIVTIGRGENSGRTIEYVNTVTELKKLADWDGTSNLSINVKTQGTGQFVVIIQEPGPGPILAAARLR